MRLKLANALLGFFCFAALGNHLTADCPAEKPSCTCSKPVDDPIDYNKAYLTGDWEGWRKWLVDKGITITSSFTTDILGNPIGGKQQRLSHADSFGFNFLADLEKLYGMTGWEFFYSIVIRGGENLATTIGNQFPPAQVFGGETWRLNELYLRKTLFDDHMHIKFGRLDGGNDFLQSPFYYDFISNAFDGNPIGIFFNVPFTAYPNATWGAYVDVKFGKFLCKAAVYNANADVSDNRYHGFNFSFNNTAGILYITEWAYLRNQDPCDKGLPGNYRGGLYYTSGSKDNFLGGSTRGNYGSYILIDQMILREGGPKSTRGLTFFATVLVCPTNRNQFPYFTNGGLIYEGLFAEREKDITSFGVAYGSYSADLRQAQREAQQQGINGPFGNQPQNFETVIELNHQFIVNDWFTVMPGAQYIINPKGFGTIRNAWVFGAQIAVTF